MFPSCIAANLHQADGLREPSQSITPCSPIRSSNPHNSRNSSRPIPEIFQAIRNDRNEQTPSTRTSVPTLWDQQIHVLSSHKIESSRLLAICLNTFHCNRTSASTLQNNCSNSQLVSRLYLDPFKLRAQYEEANIRIAQDKIRYCAFGNAATIRKHEHAKHQVSLYIPPQFTWGFQLDDLASCLFINSEIRFWNWTGKQVFIQEI